MNDKSSVPLSFLNKPSYHYRCANCDFGLLIPDQSTFNYNEPTFSIEARKLCEWDPDWITYRFFVAYTCNNPACGEISYVTGDGFVEQRYSCEGEHEYHDIFTIQSFFPSPRLCYVPPDAPEEVIDLLYTSFSLFWVDISAAAGAMRASLERLLDTLKIPSFGTRKGGREYRLNLHNRLDRWMKSDSDHAELCFTLKTVGNLGSHGETVDKDHYLNCIDIYSHILRKLFDENPQRLRNIADKINSDIAERY